MNSHLPGTIVGSINILLNKAGIIVGALNGREASYRLILTVDGIMWNVLTELGMLTCYFFAGELRELKQLLNDTQVHAPLLDTRITHDERRQR